MWKKMKIRIIKQKFIRVKLIMFRVKLIMFMKKKTFQSQQFDFQYLKIIINNKYI